MINLCICNFFELIIYVIIVSNGECETSLCWLLHSFSSPSILSMDWIKSCSIFLLFSIIRFTQMYVTIQICRCTLRKKVVGYKSCHWDGSNIYLLRTNIYTFGINMYLWVTKVYRLKGNHPSDSFCTFFFQRVCLLYFSTLVFCKRTWNGFRVKSMYMHKTEHVDIHFEGICIYISLSL